MPRSADLVYLDSSAVVKLFLPEPEARSLRRYLTPRRRRVSSLLMRTEALRAAMRAGLAPERMRLVHALLDSIAMIPLDLHLSEEAGILRPAELRSLDAVHLATARSLGGRLTAFVTYDERQAAAAAWYGLPLVTPS